RGATPPDPHRLYEAAVQDAPHEVNLLERLLRRAGRQPLRLREDFSGTALLCAEWVRRGRDRTAVAVDLDPAVHAWARAHRLPELGDAAARLRLLTADVREPNGRGYDAVVALNFSYCVFKTRDALRAYLRRARAALAPGGVFVLDVQGGWESQKPLVESRRIRGGARYVWEQESFDPITHRLVAAIHFDVPGRPRLSHAFRYDWRLWTLPELTELFTEAGLERIEVFWDVAPSDDATKYAPRRSAANQAGWIAYVVGRRPDARGRGAAPRPERGAR
ncbi:MAG TPA: class I SAM-dependent methyltransferase, partial [Anaeromyxobacteraceae bacterium]|nr:class I SAM-dependent methyltransferase [Anaeromyxobacteraceae bacterium]